MQQQWVSRVPCQNAQKAKGLIFAFFSSSMGGGGGGVSIKCFLDEGKAILVGQSLFAHLPNKNISQVFSKSHKQSNKKFNYKMFFYGVTLLK